MFITQFFLRSLGHASYLVGDDATGEALLLDPRRDVEEYLAAARDNGWRIGYALDSHGHNDYLSGLAEIRARTDAEILGSAAGQLGYPHRPVKDGETIELGDVVIEVVHTPGHTPEHVALLVRDLAVGDEPAALLSGGSLLVGDLARPDLLGGPDAAREAARTLADTIQTRILPLPDHVEVFPTHVAGSLCGGHIGSRLSTTIGYERRTNPVLAGLAAGGEVPLDNLPGVPPYWRRMRGQNLAGVTPLGVLREPPALPPETVTRRLADVVVLDTRSPAAYGAGHIPGALNVGLGTSFATWAGTVLPADARILLVVEDPGQVWEATWQLLRIGYDVPVGWLAGGMAAWQTFGGDLERLDQRSVEQVHVLLQRGEVEVLDVRQPAEWAEGHIGGARLITGAEVPERLGEIPSDRPVAVVCGTGYRSSAVASLLARHGHRQLINVIGGMSAWQAKGLPTVT